MIPYRPRQIHVNKNAQLTDVFGFNRNTLIPRPQKITPGTNVIPNVSNRSIHVNRIVGMVTLNIAPRRSTRYVIGVPISTP